MLSLDYINNESKVLINCSVFHILVCVFGVGGEEGTIPVLSVLTDLDCKTPDSHKVAAKN